MKITVKEESMLGVLLEKEFTSASKTTVRKMVKHGQVKVNGVLTMRTDFLVKPGDLVEYIKTLRLPEVEQTPYRVVFEDEHILVSDKPAGVLTIGYTMDQGESSFYKEWLQYIRDRSRGKERVFIVHRLDKEVSGLIVFAKSEKVQKELKDNWHMNTKLYYAFVEGKPPKSIGKVSSYLAEGPKEKVFSSQDPSKGKLAVTQYRIMKEFPGYTLQEIKLETGRKNQVRVHLADIGCPIVGDRRYGAKDKFKRRIRLHAFYLSFVHPATNEQKEFRSSIPKGFTVLKEGDEKYK
jgi:23S rRNA pseudouridine1911/1915/1917 synthase